jgi:adenylate kinase
LTRSKAVTSPNFLVRFSTVMVGIPGRGKASLVARAAANLPMLRNRHNLNLRAAWRLGSGC